MNDTAQMGNSAPGENLNGLTDFMTNYDCVALDLRITHNGQDAGILKLSYELTGGQSLLVAQ